MKKILIFCAFIAGIISSGAQTVIDNFTVGPYVVDYNGQGDVKYRLRDNINLYEFFELKPDTVYINNPVASRKIDSAFQVDVKIGAGLFAAKEYGIEGMWKKSVATDWFFNCGLSLSLADRKMENSNRYDMVEIGIPLEIEYCRLYRYKSSLYALAGVAPALFVKGKAPEGTKKNGFIVAPKIEMGGNIPIGNYLLRIGAYATYKINNNVYKDYIGRAFIGGKVGIIF